MLVQVVLLPLAVQTYQVLPVVPLVFENRLPILQVDPDGVPLPTPQVAAFGLLVKRDSPIIVLLPEVISSPSTYMATVASVRVVEVRLSVMVLVAPPDPPTAPLVIAMRLRSLTDFPELLVMLITLVTLVPPEMLNRTLLCALAFEPIRTPSPNPSTCTSSMELLEASRNTPALGMVPLSPVLPVHVMLCSPRVLTPLI